MEKMMKRNPQDLYTQLITLDGLTSVEMNTNKLLTRQQRHFKIENLINTIEGVSPSTGRIKALAILLCFGKQMINIPTITSAERLLRNNKIYTQYKKGSSYADLSRQFNISERWIRSIIKIMIHRSIHR